VNEEGRAGRHVRPAAALNQGMSFEGRRIPIWKQQQGIFRPALLRDPGAALSIQTSFEGPYEDRFDPEADHLVYRYRGTDPHHPDNVALRRAKELARPLVYFVAVEPGGYDAVFPCYVVGEDPAQLAFFLLADARRDVRAASVEHPLAAAPLLGVRRSSRVEKRWSGTRLHCS